MAKNHKPTFCFDGVNPLTEMPFYISFLISLLVTMDSPGAWKKSAFCIFCRRSRRIADTVSLPILGHCFSWIPMGVRVC